MHRTILGLFLALAVPAAALASGTPDPSFGDDGAVIIHADYEQPFGREFAEDMLIDHAGRYVTVGTAYFGPSKINFALGLITRHLPDGTPDTGFNGAGHVHLLWQGYGLYLFHAREQSDGKLLVTGHLVNPNSPYGPIGPAVCRVDEHGALDPTFGTAGCRTLETVGDRPGLQLIDDMELQIDGRIFVLGEPIEDPDVPRGFALVRLLPNGSDDLDFGAPSGCLNPSPGCGIAYSPEPLGGEIHGAALALDPQQGRIVVGAHMNIGTFQLVTAFRYTAAGNLETIFESQNFDGLTGDPDTTHEMVDVEVAPDSSLLLTAKLNSDNNYSVAIAKLRADGVHDDLFGNAGRAVYVFDALDTDNVASGSFLQSDGKLLVAGYSGPQQAWRCQVLRIDSTTGAPDARFGLDGVATPATLNALSPDDCYTSAVASDGHHVLVAGTSYTSGEDSNPFLLRLDRDGLFGDGFED